jgi:hypothetical protein
MTIITLDARDATELTTTIACFAGWLRAYVEHAQHRLPLARHHRQGNPMVTQRPARPGELCTCGRPAQIVFLTEQWGPTRWCGISDRGATGPCVFCNGPAHTNERCPRYQLHPPQPQP